MFVNIGYQWTPSSEPYMDSRGELIYEPINKKKLWNRKQIVKLLLIVTVADPKRFTAKGKSITYTEAFVELYK